MTVSIQMIQLFRRMGETRVFFDVCMLNGAGMFTPPSADNKKRNQKVCQSVMARYRDFAINGDLLCKRQLVKFKRGLWEDHPGIDVVAEVTYFDNCNVRLHCDLDEPGQDITVPLAGLRKMIKEADCEFIFDPKRGSNKIPQVHVPCDDSNQSDENSEDIMAEEEDDDPL